MPLVRVQHPGWLGDPAVGLGQGTDIGLFQLELPVLGISSATLYTGSSELGANITLIGAGSAGIGSEGPRLNPTPLFYAGTNVIDRVVELDNGGGLLAFDFDDGSVNRNTLADNLIYDVSAFELDAISEGTVFSQTSSISVTSLEGTTAAGDSGAPAFADFGNGPELVGLVSWGVNPSEPTNLYGSTYGDVTYLTRISSSRDWILAVIPEPRSTVFILGFLAFLGVLALKASRTL